MKKVWSVIVLLLVCTIYLSGCQFGGFDTLSLMRPPKATGDEANIQQILEEVGGSDLTLKYPQKGDYRSAIVMYDITGDGEEEAVAFYTSNKSKDTSTHMMIIGITDGKWTNWGDFIGLGSTVDRICFGDLDGDGIHEIIVGWGNSYNTLNALSVYQYQDGKIVSIEVDYNYSSIAVADFGKNGEDEIFISTLNDVSEDVVADAKLLKMDDETGQINNISRVELDPTVVRYEAMTVGDISPGVMGVVIDGYREDGMMETEIVYWDKERNGMMAPLSSKGESNPTERVTSTISSDIDGNGVIEIPFVTQMPGEAEQSDGTEPCYLTQWNWFNVANGTWEFVYNMITNFSDGYGFQLPEEWEGHVTAKIETETKTLTFYEWVVDQDGVGARGVEILQIQVFSDSEWQDESKTEGFTVLRKQNGRVYAVQIPGTGSPYSLTYEEVQKNFKLVSNSL